MTVKEVIPLATPGVAPIAAAVRWGDLLFVSGLAAIDPMTGEPRGETIDEQAEWALASLSTLLGRCKAKLSNVLRIECYLARAEFFPAWNEAFGRHFPEGPPARTTLVCGFARPGMLIELQATCGLTT